MIQKVEVGSAARKTADVLREEILRRHDAEEFLGSEDELISKLGVSRPTLRQAARILEAEGLLTVRRGWNGGFFTRRPEVTGVAHMTGLYLRSQHATFGDVWEMWTVLGAQAARLAAENSDEQARRALADEVEAARPVTPDDTSRLTRIRSQFLLRVAQLVPSVTLNVLVYSLSEATRTSYAARWFMEPEQQAFTYDYLEKISKAIARGYGEAASRHYLAFGKEASERFPMLMADPIEPRFESA